ncbi:MAG: hypothetical protein WBP58_15540 [Chitinophagaceae bacterium]
MKPWWIVLVAMLIWGRLDAQLTTDPAADTMAVAKKSEKLILRGSIMDTTYKNVASGEFTPGRGFDLVRTKYGSLNISMYAMARYLNQMPGNQEWYDHLGRKREMNGRNDFYFHRAMIWFTGFVGTPKLNYNVTVWTIMPTQQTLVYGNLQYRFNKHFKLGIGVAPNLSIRSMQGPFPFFSSTDRTMGEESLRGGFTQGVFLLGQITDKLYYTVMVGNNLSTLGISASKETRDLSKSASIWWMPTTGEFGPRGGIGDLEYHKKAATRFGFSYVNSREDRFNNTGTPSPDNTQVRMTDGVLFFETGALADGVTVDQADYNMFDVDLGVKYKGFHAQADIVWRNLSNFKADGKVPETQLTDMGYSLQLSQVIVRNKLVGYFNHSYFWDAFNRHPYEFGGGVNFYPVKSRNWRLNVQMMRVYKTSAGGTFGLYNAGQTGTTVTMGTDILL